LSKTVISALARNGSFDFADGLASCVGAKANVPFVRWLKIELKKMCGGENKKYRRVGNECRLILCPINISFLFCLFTMVYFQFSTVVSVFLRLLVTFGGMKSCRLRAISCQVTQKLKRATTLE
jgi:hypothetical protein